MDKDKKLSVDEIANLDELYLLTYLECPIDNMISLNPLMCKKCETIFCSDCIEDWKKRSNVCPMRCNPIQLISTEKTIVRQQINKIKKHCPYQKHGCLERILLSDLPRHEKTCEYRETLCDKCREVVPMINYTNHLYEVCSKNMIKCPICETYLNLEVLLKHIDDCRQKTKLCEHCCKNESISPHICEMRLVECPSCQFPELSRNVKKSYHKCIEDKDNATNINTYLKNIHSQFEGELDASQSEREDKIKEFNDKLAELTKEVMNKECDKANILENKVNKLTEDSMKRINNIKRERLDTLNKIKSDISEWNNLITSNIYYLS